MERVIKRLALGLLAFVVFTALALAACEHQAPAEPTEPAGPRPTMTGKIAFTRGGPASGSIYVMNADGTDARRLTQVKGDDSSPKWSPDGKRIVFARMLTTGSPPSSRQIWVMNSDGSGQTRLTDDPGRDALLVGETWMSDDHPAWSADGGKIAFVRTRNRKVPFVNSGGQAEGYTWVDAGQIYLMNQDGRSPTPLTVSELSASAPTWSPDGKRIAFAGSPVPQLIRAGPIAEPQTQIYVVNVDGSGLTKLTGLPGIFRGSVSWSPDGRKIAFDRGRLFTMNADGTDPTRLTIGGGSSPAWSPDGQAIAFQRSEAFGLYGINSDIYVMNASGSGVVRLTTGRDGGSPAWSPVLDGS